MLKAHRVVVGRSTLSACALSLGRVSSCRAFGGYKKLAVSQEASAREVVRGPTTMSASEALVETLVSHGVKNVFGIVGSAFMDALDLFPEAGIRFIGNQHEQNSVHMADGYARVSGDVGVVIGQNGPGITNFVTAAGAAYWAHSPVVMLTPESGSNTRGMGGFQEVPGKGGQMEIFAPVTKYQVDIKNPTRFAEQTSYAFDMARFERGPVQVNFARDLLYHVGEYSIPKPRRVQLPSASASQLKEASQLLATARNPVILAGAGVAIGGGIESVVALAECLSIPVCTTYQHNDCFPNSHPLFMGALGYQGSLAAMQCVKEADCVLALGSRLNPFGTLPQYHQVMGDYWPQTATLIQCDIDHRRLALTREANLCIQADAKQVADGLLAHLSAAECVAACVQNADSRKKAMNAMKNGWNQTLDAWTFGDSMRHLEKKGRVRPRQALRAIEKVLPKDVVVSTDIGNLCSVANSYLNVFNDASARQSFLAPLTFGNCQYSFGAALGAKVAAPHRAVVSIVGDGAWGMALNELLTCQREEVAVTVVVFNNGQWGAEKKNQVLWFGDRYIGVQLEDGRFQQQPISFAKIAQSMGAEGIVVEKAEDVSGAIEQALDNQMQKGRATVVEVMCTKELADPFRRDAMKLPTRHLDKYKCTNQTQESQTGQPTDF